MYDNCLNCGGLIFPPGILVGYAGPVCLCPKDPKHQYQRPASKEAPARLAQEKGVMTMSPEESKKHNEAMLSFFGDEKAAAPGEESWEKLREFGAEKHISAQYPLGKTPEEFNKEDEYERIAYRSGFDAAVTQIARPLLANFREAFDGHIYEMDQAKKARHEVDKLHVELSSLKATEAALRSSIRELNETFEMNYDQKEAIRQQRDRLAMALDAIAEGAGYAKGEEPAEVILAREVLADLKAPSDSVGDAGEGEIPPSHHTECHRSSCEGECWEWKK